MVLAGDVASSCGKVERRDVVRAVSILQFDGTGASSQGKKLVTQTDTHDRNLGRLHQLAEMEDGILAMGWVTGPIGDENSVEMMGNLVNRIVVRESSDTGTAVDQTPENVFLDTTVDDGDVIVALRGADVEGSLGADFLDQVDLLRVDECLVLVGIILFSDCDASKRRASLSKVSHNGTGIHSRDGGNTFPGTPIAETLNSSPVAVLFRDIGHNDTGCLQVRRFKVFEKATGIPLSRRNTVVSDQRLREDQHLSAVRRVCQ